MQDLRFCQPKPGECFYRKVDVHDDRRGNYNIDDVASDRCCREFKRFFPIYTARIGIVIFNGDKHQNLYLNGMFKNRASILYKYRCYVKEVVKVFTLICDVTRYTFNNIFRCNDGNINSHDK